jgi:hypothetical protein
VSREERFIQLRASAIDYALEQLQRVGAPDLLASNMLLFDLLVASGWREPGRGALRITKHDLADRWHAGRHRIDSLFDSIEAADLIRADFVRGREGEIVVLDYDALVRTPGARLLASRGSARAAADRATRGNAPARAAGDLATRGNPARAAADSALAPQRHMARVAADRATRGNAR